MLAKARWSVALTAVLLIGSCSSDSGISSDSDSSEAICDGQGPPDSLEPDKVALIESDTAVNPGGTVRFEWPLDRLGSDSTTGDEAIIECWTSAGWEPAYAVTGIFGDAPAAFTLDQIPDFTDDGRFETVGVLPVPEWAEPGTYRYVAERFETSEERLSGEGRFIVTV